MAQTQTYRTGRLSQGISYAAWHAAYDQALIVRCGMTSDDLPDIYSETAAYESDLTPAEAADACLAEHGFGEESDTSGEWY